MQPTQQNQRTRMFSDIFISLLMNEYLSILVTLIANECPSVPTKACPIFETQLRSLKLYAQLLFEKKLRQE